eukprot:TRINITY_DN10253_c0_g1_i1.p1 TRINITY_DN10253_c0_g1~~TRINITY_DN10253_c0_g1_i1.p1  ORF type:complete len:423 (+),score=82.37 TRINITY_DN10253_c0_g1_i1:65-1270(+)
MSDTDGAPAPRAPPAAGSDPAARGSRGDLLHRGNGVETSSEEDEDQSQPLDPRRHRPRGSQQRHLGLSRRRPPHGLPCQAPPQPQDDSGGLLAALGLRRSAPPVSDEDRKRCAARSLLVNMGYASDEVRLAQQAADAPGDSVGGLRAWLHTQRPGSAPPDSHRCPQCSPSRARPRWCRHSRARPLASPRHRPPGAASPRSPAPSRRRAPAAAEAAAGEEWRCDCSPPAGGGPRAEPGGRWWGPARWWASPAVRTAAAMAVPLPGCMLFCMPCPGRATAEDAERDPEDRDRDGMLGCYGGSGPAAPPESQPAPGTAPRSPPSAAGRTHAAATPTARAQQPTAAARGAKALQAAASALPLWMLQPTTWFDGAKSTVRRKMENDDKQFLMRNKDHLRGLATHSS